MTVIEILGNLMEIQHELEVMRKAAEDSKLPTAITMGLEWLREDTGKVIADVDVALLKMGQ
jgi:hypothetical protein